MEKNINFRFLKLKGVDSENMAITTDTIKRWLSGMKYSAADMANVTDLSIRPSDEFINGAVTIIELLENQFQQHIDNAMVNMQIAELNISTMTKIDPDTNMPIIDENDKNNRLPPKK